MRLDERMEASRISYQTTSLMTTAKKLECLCPAFWGTTFYSLVILKLACMDWILAFHINKLYWKNLHWTSTLAYFATPSMAIEKVM